MSVGKFTSLEEVRKDPKLLKQFIRERVEAGQGEGDETRVEKHASVHAQKLASNRENITEGE